MQIQANSPGDYISKLPEERQEPMQKLREVIQKNLPKGFEETMSYGMIGYVVPHSLYPAGYHVDPKLPLPFVHIASQKNFIAVYHSGVYADKAIYDWFVAEYPKYCKSKLDMGKSCIRFKKLNEFPYDLIAELMKKLTPQQWIEIYEQNINR
ncbi:DUF1801 domain-containing protein [Maribellus sediminis]|uniref:DUF1801 domain-containing protein n=1 Tax=Maribellus sediminis TaxID=2696285 RepID=UPI001431DE27|nr:DUF1801 domain-containing protein [Maribellus sediminis]